MIEKKILVVDDEPGSLTVLDRSLSKRGFEVTKALSAKQALEEYDKNGFPVVVTDINMPGITGLELLKSLRERDKGILVVMMTAYADLDSAISALRHGAYDYIIKPFKPDIMYNTLERAFEKLHLTDELDYFKRQVNERFEFSTIVGNSDAIQQTIRKARKIAAADESLLISGATGTGKEVFARAIHLASPRRNKRFVPVNCAAFPETLIESELFGHVKGAFTGANRDKAGLIEEADGGTIFLDEITEIPQSMQIKLLRFLQDHRVRRVGSTTEKHVDVKVITATNRPINDEIFDGFRQDLFFRLRVLTLEIPPLTERTGDVTVLFRYFLRQACTRSGRDELAVSDDVIACLNQYDWPGNVRELENLSRNLVVMSDGPRIELSDLPPFVQPANNEPPAHNFLATGRDYSQIREQVLADFNRKIITEALELENGNISKAAERLGTAKSNVIRLIKKLDLATAFDDRSSAHG